MARTVCILQLQESLLRYGHRVGHGHGHGIFILATHPRVHDSYSNSPGWIERHQVFSAVRQWRGPGNSGLPGCHSDIQTTLMNSIKCLLCNQNILILSVPGTVEPRASVGAPLIEQHPRRLLLKAAERMLACNCEKGQWCTFSEGPRLRKMNPPRIERIERIGLQISSEIVFREVSSRDSELKCCPQLILAFWHHVCYMENKSTTHRTHRYNSCVPCVKVYFLDFAKAVTVSYRLSTLWHLIASERSD